ncbi:MAG: class I SAM-dependent methyltransferase [Bacteroidetes bacterium]|nr:class I SAM-dependent methyltransferase [Bacteroidota bacterium]
MPKFNNFSPVIRLGAILGILRDLLESSNARKLHLIDPWYFLDAEWSWAGGNPSTVDAVVNILREFKKEIETGRVLVHIEDDCKVLKDFPNEYFDWVYLDSSHAYEHTVKELNILAAKVKNHGIITGDDWRPDPNHRHHGVYKAVTEFMKKYGFELVYASEENLQWAIKKPNIL